MTTRSTTEQNSGIKNYFKNMALASIGVASVVCAGYWAVHFLGEFIAKVSSVTPLELANLVVRSTGAY